MSRGHRVPTAGIILAGGRSSRMGAAKAWLEWDGSTLLRRTVDVVAGVVDVVVVVRSAGQALPALPPQVRMVDDERPGRGPLQGMLSGLRALDETDAVAFVCATDMPLLHPAFVARVLALLPPDADAAVPRIGNARHPLAGAYRTRLAPDLAHLLEGDRRSLMGLLDRCRVRWLDADTLLGDRSLAAADPGLDSLLDLNTPATIDPAAPSSSSPIHASAVAPASDVTA